jgi:hypothetical protein
VCGDVLRVGVERDDGVEGAVQIRQVLRGVTSDDTQGNKKRDRP